MTDYTNTPPGKQVTREVSIRSVDVVNRSATGVNRFQVETYINTSYYVGSVQITPVVGDQWMVEKINGDWRLSQRISFNDPNQSIVPTQGQHIVGSGAGPVELSGTAVNLYSPLSTQAVSTSARPDPTSVPAGTQIYDATLGQPIWSNGTTWHDSAGNAI